MKNDILNCPICGGTEFILAEQSGFANVHIKKGLSFKEAAIKHQVCMKCGTIVRSYVEDLDRLMSKNE